MGHIRNGTDQGAECSDHGDVGYVSHYFGCRAGRFRRCAVWFTAQIVRPIRRLNTAVKEVAAGDLTKTIQVSGKDEVAVLSGDFNQTVSHLKHLVLGVNDSSRQVMSVTETVSSGVETAMDSVDRIGASIRQIASGANAHASSSNEIAVSMSDMASGIVKIAETSSMVSEVAQEAQVKRRPDRLSLNKP